MQQWLAMTWEASLLKITAGAALGAVLSWLTTSDVHPLLVAVGAAVIPILVNWLNDQDPRYGIGQRPHYSDLSTTAEMEIQGEDV